MKVMLASDYVEGKLRFPLGAQPKIDGVRGHTPDGVLLARSNKTHRNAHTTRLYSAPEYMGMDGELAAAHECDPKLCRITSSALSTIEGEPFTLWWVFDLLAEEHVGRPYIHRYEMLKRHVAHLQGMNMAMHCRVVPMVICNNLEELLHWDALWLEKGYEGTIIRDLNGLHKQGRSTVREMGLLRIKRFVEEEARVLSIVEGQHNGNEAQTNELGKTFRSSHSEHMVPNGQVGSFTCVILKDSELFKAGQVITVSPGTLTLPEREHYFRNQGEIVGQVITFKHFPKGVKDQPRFPTFVSIRSPENM